jgi:1,4-dihydroxy-2-naphthoate octaprenyltransferase
MLASPSAWILAARPKTLPAAVAPVVAGTVLGAQLSVSGSLRIDLALWTLASCLALQVATNLFNDAVDHQKGADTSQRLGPRRVTASGDLSARQVFLGAGLFLVIAGLCSLPLLSARGWPILAIGLPSLYLCYGYTGGPVPLAYRGLGELFVLLCFGWVAVMGSAFVQTAAWHFEAWVLGTQIGLLSTTLIAINNLRDRKEDAQTGKRTLAVRWGVRFARCEILACLLGPALIGLGWIPLGFPAAAYGPWLSAPLAGFIAWKIFHRAPSPAYNRYLALSALHLLLTTALLVFGFLRN